MALVDGCGGCSGLQGRRSTAGVQARGRTDAGTESRWPGVTDTEMARAAVIGWQGHTEHAEMAGDFYFLEGQ